MMVQAKRIYILMIKVNKLFSFSLQNFPKEIENMFSVFLLSSINTRNSFGELEKAVETLPRRFLFPQHFSFSQTSTHVSIAQQKHSNRNAVHVFCFLINTIFSCQKQPFLVIILKCKISQHRPEEGQKNTSTKKCHVTSLTPRSNTLRAAETAVPKALASQHPLPT